MEAVVTLCLFFRVLQVPCSPTRFRKKSEPTSTWLTLLSVPIIAGCTLESLSSQKHLLAHICHKVKAVTRHCDIKTSAILIFCKHIPDMINQGEMASPDPRMRLFRAADNSGVRKVSRCSLQSSDIQAGVFLALRFLLRILVLTSCCLHDISRTVSSVLSFLQTRSSCFWSGS